VSNGVTDDAEGILTAVSEGIWLLFGLFFAGLGIMLAWKGAIQIDERFGIGGKKVDETEKPGGN